MTTLGRLAPWTPRVLPFPNIGASGWVIAGVIIVAVSAAAPVVQNSLITTQGRNLETLEAEQTAIQVEMRKIEAEIARLISVDRIAWRAEAIGLIPGQGAIFVTIGEAGPEAPKIPAEHLPESPEPGSGLAP